MGTTSIARKQAAPTRPRGWAKAALWLLIALLATGLARVDADGLPAYLEATNWRNAALYARHGFEVMGVVEAPGYPEIIAMWRPARRIDAAR